MTPTIQWPRKTRELHNHHFDSTAWNDFRFRDDDIVIATYAKAGTTWLQHIVFQLLFDETEGLNFHDLSPWLDVRIMPTAEKHAMLEAQTHRRFIKTHLPVDALVYAPQAKYLYVARDGRDIAWSMHNHVYNATDFFFQLINDTPGRVGPALERVPASVRDFFLTWLERDGHPFWPFFDHVRGWWQIRGLPNLLVLHHAEMRADLPGAVRRIAAFLDVPLDAARLSRVVKRCSFDYMKANAAQVTPPIAASVFERGADTFINKGTNGRWRDVLTAAECRLYEDTARRELGDLCAAWLSAGWSVAKVA